MNNEQAYILNSDQQNAVNTIISFIDNPPANFNRLFLVNGPAGSGKTTIIAYIIKHFLHTKDIAISASTNKAVQVLKAKVIELVALEKTKVRIEFSTIHHFLGLKLIENDNKNIISQYSSPTIYRFDILIVDESSMINDSIYQKIIQSKRNTFVIFVGDASQLPPALSPTISKVFTCVQKTITLNSIVRQNSQSPIIDLSSSILSFIERNQKINKNQLAELIKNEKTSDLGIVFGKEEAAINILLYETTKKLDARILCYTNNAVLKYNKFIHNYFYPDAQFPFSPGEKVIANKQFNSVRAKGLKVSTIFNSEELIIESIHRKEHPAFPNIPACFIRFRIAGYTEQFACYFPLDYTLAESEAMKSGQPLFKLFYKSFAPLRHSYSSTVHKAQGSTFDTAIIDFDDFLKLNSAFEFNRLLYVAVTRPAKHLAIIF